MEHGDFIFEIIALLIEMQVDLCALGNVVVSLRLSCCGRCSIGNASFSMFWSCVVGRSRSGIVESKREFEKISSAGVKRIIVSNLNNSFFSSLGISKVVIFENVGVGWSNSRSFLMRFP